MIESSLSPSEPVTLPVRSFGRIARSVIVHSLVTALMMVTPVVVFIPASLFHCALRNGRRAAWVTLALAVAIASAYVGVVPGQSAETLANAWSFLAGVTMAIAVPTLLVLPLVERGEAFGRVLALLLVGAALGLAVTELGSRAAFSFSPYDAQIVQLRASNARAVELYRVNQMNPETIRFVERVGEGSLAVYPGTVITMCALVFILSLMMLGRLPVWRNWVALRGEPVKLDTYFYRNLSLPDWLLFAFILGGLTPLATGMLQKVAANTLVVVVALYMLQGLAIFRFALVAIGASLSGTLLAWTLLLSLTCAGGVGMFVLGVAGLFDPFFDFRHFKKRKDDSHESHSD